MKLILKFLTILMLLNSYSAFAASVDYFDVKLDKTESMINEAIDITVSAMDKNGNLVTDYEGTIILISESDIEAELPKELDDSSYKFKTSDEGKVKFENGLKFKNPGKHTVNVYSLENQDILGIAEIDINSEESKSDSYISIISPEAGLKIGKNKINVSGKTNKNHKVKIILNDKDSFDTISDSNGIYEKELTGLITGDNVIKAKVIDSEGKEIGVSSPVKIEVDAVAPKINSIKVTPSEDIESEGEIKIEVISDKGLTEVSVIIDDAITKLKETKEGVYEAITRAPKEAGEYNVDLVMKNEIGNETNEKQAAKITVKSLDLNSGAEVVKVVVDGKTKKIYKITGIELTKLKTKSILVWNKITEAESYNIYKKVEGNKIELVDNVKSPRYEVAIVGKEIKYDLFLVEPVIKTQSGELLKGELSEATKIQTGPKEILILLMISLLIGFGVMSFKRKA